jgi:MOSC domain-containing protein YiiM
VGKLLDIAIRAKSRAPMERRESVQVGSDTGLAGDSRGRMVDRNVTVISREGWDAACAELGETLPWTTRRANLLVEGIDLEQTTGARLRIGPVVLEVTDECDPCERMEEQRAGLRAALMPAWRAGVQCRVLEAGELRTGDEVALES